MPCLNWEHFCGQLWWIWNTKALSSCTVLVTDIAIEMDTEESLSIGQCWVLSWCSVTSSVLCKDGEGSCAAFYGGSEKSDWLNCGTLDVSQLSQDKIRSWRCFPAVGKGRKSVSCCVIWLQLDIRVEAGNVDLPTGQLFTWHRCVYIYPGVEVHAWHHSSHSERCSFLPSCCEQKVRHETPRIFLRCEKFQA